MKKELVHLSTQLAAKEQLLASQQTAPHLASKRLMEGVRKELGELKKLFEEVKGERDEAQQRCMLFEQMARYKRKEGAEVENAMENRLFVLENLVKKKEVLIQMW
jgi:hypothetical protein